MILFRKRDGEIFYDSRKIMKYLYIYATIFFTVYGQIILKWRINKLQFSLPIGGFGDKIIALIKLVIDPFILSGLLSAFVASLFWMLVMSKLEISKAYPFMSLAPTIVFLVGIFLLDEEFTWGKVFGLILIIIGILVTVKF